MGNLIVKWIVSSVVIYFTAWLLPGVHVESLFSAFLVSLVLGLINIFIRPILVIISFPFILVSFGLVLWLINACLLILASMWVSSFNIDSFLYAMLASGIISLSGMILEGSMRKGEDS